MDAQETSREFDSNQDSEPTCCRQRELELGHYHFIRICQKERGENSIGEVLSVLDLASPIRTFCSAGEVHSSNLEFEKVTLDTLLGFSHHHSIPLVEQCQPSIFKKFHDSTAEADDCSLQSCNISVLIHPHQEALSSLYEDGAKPAECYTAEGSPICPTGAENPSDKLWELVCNIYCFPVSWVLAERRRKKDRCADYYSSRPSTNVSTQFE